jgi:hypothetical protein
MAHPGYGRDGRRLPLVEDMTVEQMRTELVADAVANYASAGGGRLLARQVAMYVRIGERTGLGAEAAIQSVLDEVATLTGRRALPVT